MTPPAVRAERSLEAWEHHVEQCPDCLTQGHDLCYEGAYLADRAAELRAAAEAATGAAGWSFAGPLRGLFLPGVPA